jgi:hypothetical protein
MTILPRSTCCTSPESSSFDLVVVLVADLVALALAHPLDDALLRGHHRVAAELHEVDRDLLHVADLEVRVVPLRLLERDLARWILDLRDDLLQHRDVDVAGLLVDDDLGLDVRAEPPRQRRHDPILDEIVEVRRDMFLLAIISRNAASTCVALAIRRLHRRTAGSAPVLPAENEMCPRDRPRGMSSSVPSCCLQPDPLLAVRGHEAEQFALGPSRAVRQPAVGFYAISRPANRS